MRLLMANLAEPNPLVERAFESIPREAFHLAVADLRTARQPSRRNAKY